MTRVEPKRTWGTRAVTAAVVANIGAVACALIVGFTIAPMEARYGRTLGDTPEWYHVLVMALVGLALVFSLLGLGSLAAAVAALVLKEPPGRPVAAIIIALLAPAATTVLLVASIVAGAASAGVG